MSLPKRVVLVGPMGAGKSTIGRMLAKELGYRFLDSDRIIEERCGANIPWVFDVEGEDGFRQRETAMLAESVVVYLKTSIEQQVERTRRDRNRPLLQNDDPEAVLKNLFAVRDPIYSRLADIVMFTDRKSPRLVVRQLVNRINPRTPRHKRQIRKEGRNHA